MNNKYLDGIMGLVVGDALGVPFEFLDRSSVNATDMVGYGTHNKPIGTWSDDSSMTIATLDSIRNNNGINLDDIMNNFVNWFKYGYYTTDGAVFDIGNTCYNAIVNYIHNNNYKECGCGGNRDNGNGSLMRILPACLYLYDLQKEMNIDDNYCIGIIHDVSSLTHSNIISKMACGIYYFIVKEIINNKGSIDEIIQKGINNAFNYYGKYKETKLNLLHFNRIKNIEIFKNTPENKINSSGYVLYTLEASIWCLLNNLSFDDTVLKAVNLGNDTDTIAAISGGLAGLYYGYSTINKKWLNYIIRRDYLENLCIEMKK